jgi:hypothetical protein
MAKKGSASVHIKHPPKKTSSSGNKAMLKTSTMSKDQKRNKKSYNGQGR